MARATSASCWSAARRGSSTEPVGVGQRPPPMICPVCGHHNLQGADECQNCGSDLRTADIPQPSNSFEERLVTEPLSSLRPAPAVTVSPRTTVSDAIGRMQDGPSGVLVVGDEHGVVGIFTERDALLKAA